MNKKYNPWVSLVALVLLAVILVTICTGCAGGNDNPPGARFTIEHQNMDGSVYGCRIITDTETGVQYLVYKSTYGVGMTVLQDGEG